MKLNKLKYSKLKDKSVHRLKIMIKKRFRNMERLHSIIKNCDDFYIDLPEESRKDIEKKIYKHYIGEIGKINNVIRNKKENHPLYQEFKDQIESCKKH